MLTELRFNIDFQSNDRVVALQNEWPLDFISMSSLLSECVFEERRFGICQ